MAKSDKQSSSLSREIATNRKARHEYELIDRYECGIVLLGSEVKSVRDGKVVIKDAYADIRDGELWLNNMYIAHYLPANRNNHETERRRKLLLHRSEINRLIGKLKEGGLTMVPVRVYLSRGRVKVEVALGRGKQGRDKREDVKRRESNREAERFLKRATR